MQNTLVVAAAFAALLSSTPAFAQAGAETGWYGGMEGGIQSVQNVAGLAGIQVGRHLSSRADVFGEAVFLQDTITRRRSESANSVAAYLTQSQGRSASASIDSPSVAFSAGVRYYLTGVRNLRPYVTGSAGAARVTLRPVFLLAGADVTTLLGQYGVTLGSDLTGTTTQPAFGGGVGVVAGRGPWYLDAGLRLTSIRLTGQPANVLGLAIGIGRTF